MSEHEEPPVDLPLVPLPGSNRHSAEVIAPALVPQDLTAEIEVTVILRRRPGANQFDPSVRLSREDFATLMGADDADAVWLCGWSKHALTTPDSNPSAHASSVMHPVRRSWRRLNVSVGMAAVKACVDATNHRGARLDRHQTSGAPTRNAHRPPGAQGTSQCIAERWTPLTCPFL